MDEEELKGLLYQIERDRRNERNDKIVLGVFLAVALIGVATATWFAVWALPL